MNWHQIGARARDEGNLRIAAFCWNISYIAEASAPAPVLSVEHKDWVWQTVVEHHLRWAPVACLDRFFEDKVSAARDEIRFYDLEAWGAFEKQRDADLAEELRRLADEREFQWD